MKARGCGMVNFFEHPSSTRWNGLRAHILRVYDLRELSFFFFACKRPASFHSAFFSFSHLFSGRRERIYERREEVREKYEASWGANHSLPVFRVVVARAVLAYAKQVVERTL